MIRKILLPTFLLLFSLSCSFLPSALEPAPTLNPAVPEPTYKRAAERTSTLTPISPTPTETGPAVISWKDAGSHVGSISTVCGEIILVANLLDNRIILNMGEKQVDDRFIIVVKDASIFPENGLDSLYGEKICVTGEIIQEEDRFGIFITDPAQINANPSVPIGEQAAYLFRDDFVNDLQTGWEWLNENPSRWEITTDGWLRILGEDISLFANGTQKNLLCRDAPDGEFQVTTHVSAVPSQDFQQAAIFLYKDADNFVAMNRGYCGPCDTGGDGIYMDSFKADNWQGMGAPTRETDVFLRLVVQGGTITGYYALEDGEWQGIWTVENHLGGPRICLGVSNVDSANIDADLTGKFDYLEVSRP